MRDVATAKVRLIDGSQMPVLGLGAYKLEGKVANVVQTAIDNGYRLIDTAAMYANEHEVGEGVKRAIDSNIVSREEIFVTTKVWKTELGYEQTLAAFEESYRRLGLEYIDLYLIHWPGSDEQNLGSWEALIELQKSGKVKSIGVSNFEPEHLLPIMEQTGVTPVVNQVEYNAAHLRTTLHQFCREHGIQMESWGPLGHGRLLAEPLFIEIGQRYGKTAAQVLLRWVVQNGVIVIPKTSREERMRENADIFDFELTSEEMSRITSLGEEIKK